MGCPGILTYRLTYPGILFAVFCKAVKMSSSNYVSKQDSLHFVQSPMKHDLDTSSISSSSGTYVSRNDTSVFFPSPEGGFIPQSPKTPRNLLPRSLQFALETELGVPLNRSPSPLNCTGHKIRSLEDEPCFIPSPKHMKLGNLGNISTPKSGSSEWLLDTIEENTFLEEYWSDSSDGNSSVCSGVSELGEVFPTPEKKLRRLQRVLNSDFRRKYQKITIICKLFNNLFQLRGHYYFYISQTYYVA